MAFEEEIARLLKKYPQPEEDNGGADTALWDTELWGPQPEAKSWGEWASAISKGVGLMQPGGLLAIPLQAAAHELNPGRYRSVGNWLGRNQPATYGGGGLFSSGRTNLGRVGGIFGGLYDYATGQGAWDADVASKYGSGLGTAQTAMLAEQENWFGGDTNFFSSSNYVSGGAPVQTFPAYAGGDDFGFSDSSVATTGGYEDDPSGFGSDFGF